GDDVTAAAYLPETCQAGLRTEAAEMMRFVILEVGLEERARSNQRHVTTEDVPDLWQLVEAPSPQKTPDSRYARIVGDLEQPRVAGVIQPGELRLFGVCTIVHR